MCGENKRFLFYLLLALFFASVAGALRGEEPGPWYLISEAELRSIEKYRDKSEAEKQDWQLQAQGLKRQAESLKTQAGSLRRESEVLNDQLAQAREQNRNSERLYNELEAGWLTRLSLKNGEIAGLEQEAESYKGKARSRLVVIIALGAAWVVFIVFKVRRFSGL